MERSRRQKALIYFGLADDPDKPVPDADQEPSRLQKAKDFWWTIFGLAVLGNLVHTFVEGSAVVETYRDVMGVIWIAATVFLLVAFARHRLALRRASAP